MDIAEGKLIQENIFQVFPPKQALALKTFCNEIKKNVESEVVTGNRRKPLFTANNLSEIVNILHEKGKHCKMIHNLETCV